MSLFSEAEMGGPWRVVPDGDSEARMIFHRHYSFKPYRDGRDPKLFCGPGEKMILITWEGDALFIWRRFISADGQSGINCAAFRNEGARLSSELIQEAESMARKKWPNEKRLYTYVNARKIRSSNPGACFKAAGWIDIGETKWNKLRILEKALAHEAPEAMSAEGEG